MQSFLQLWLQISTISIFEQAEAIIQCRYKFQHLKRSQNARRQVQILPNDQKPRQRAHISNITLQTLAETRLWISQIHYHLSSSRKNSIHVSCLQNNVQSLGNNQTFHQCAQISVIAMKTLPKSTNSSTIPYHSTDFWWFQSNEKTNIYLDCSDLGVLQSNPSSSKNIGMSSPVRWQVADTLASHEDSRGPSILRIRRLRTSVPVSSRQWRRVGPEEGVSVEHAEPLHRMDEWLIVGRLLGWMISVHGQSSFGFTSSDGIM